MRTIFLYISNGYRLIVIYKEFKVNIYNEPLKTFVLRLPGLSGKESACNEGDLGLIPELG